MQLVRYERIQRARFLRTFGKRKPIASVCLCLALLAVTGCNSVHLEYDPATGRFVYDRSSIVGTEEVATEATASMPAGGTLSIKQTKKSDQTAAILAAQDAANKATAIIATLHP